MIIQKGPFQNLVWAFFVFLFVGDFTNLAAQKVVILVNKTEIDWYQNEVCYQNSAIEKDLIEECIIKNLQQYYTLHCLCENDFEVYWSDKRDSLYIKRMEGKQLNFTVSGGRGLPKNWLSSLEKNDEFTLERLSKLLDQINFNEPKALFFRSDSSKNQLQLVLNRQKEASSIDFTAGIGSGTAFAFYGQGDVSLVDLFTTYSISTLFFERLAERNSEIRVQHNQLKPLFLFGPNQFKLQAVQRDTLFRQTFFQVVRSFYRNTQTHFSLSAVYSSSVNKDPRSRSSLEGSSIAGSHRTIGWSIKWANFEDQRLNTPRKNTSRLLYSFGVKQLFKNFTSELNSQAIDETQTSFENEQLFRVEFQTSSDLYLNELLNWHSRVKYHSTPTKILLSPSEVGTYGGIKSMRGYPENAYLSREAIIANNELRAFVAAESYLFTFIDWARLKVNQEITNVFNSRWNNEGVNRYLFSSGVGLVNRTKQTQTEVVVAFTREYGFFNPRIHIGFKRLF